MGGVIKIRFTTIIHPWRREFGLSWPEYGMCDIINLMCGSRESKVPGWCYMSRVNLGAEVGISKQAAIDMVERMIKKGLVEKHEITKHLRTTPKWQQVYIDGALPGVKSLDRGGQVGLPGNGQVTLPEEVNSKKNLEEGGTNGTLPFKKKVKYTANEMKKMTPADFQQLFPSISVYLKLSQGESWDLKKFIEEHGNQIQYVEPVIQGDDRRTKAKMDLLMKWLNYKKVERGEQYKSTKGIKGCWNDIVEYGVESAGEAIDVAIKARYKGFFPKNKKANFKDRLNHSERD